MRRALHMVITLAVILVMIRPADCFTGSTTKQATDCCAKGKCLPTHDADDCCKATLPADAQVIAAKVSRGAPVPGLEISAILAPSAVPLETFGPMRPAERMHVNSPGSPPGFNRSLPLLI